MVKKLINFIRFGIQLPDWYERRLRLWAAVKGTTRATLGANILQARIEATRSEVDQAVREIAELRGITPEEAEKALLNEGEDDE